MIQDCTERCFQTDYYYTYLPLYHNIVSQDKFFSFHSKYYIKTYISKALYIKDKAMDYLYEEMFVKVLLLFSIDEASLDGTDQYRTDTTINSSLDYENDGRKTLEPGEAKNFTYCRSGPCIHHI